MPRKLGTLTIGQAPRADMVAILDLYLPADVTCVHAGVLDDLSRSEIEAKFAACADEEKLISRLLTGEAVILGKEAIAAGLQQKIEMLEARGCGKILILCTGTFDHLRAMTAWLIEPDQIVPPGVAGLAGDRQVGIIVPLLSQVEAGLQKWTVLSKLPICAAASPYGVDGSMEALAEAARSLRDRGADLLLLDCMGFTEAHRQLAKQASGLPVILSNALMARLMAELV